MVELRAARKEPTMAVHLDAPLAGVRVAKMVVETVACSVVSTAG